MSATTLLTRRENVQNSPSGPSTTLRVALPVVVVVVGCFSAGRGDQGRIGEWGLIQALPWLYFASVAALTVSFFVELRRDGLNIPALGLHLVGLVVLLYGAPGFLEAEPRFATAWLHAGFTEQILDNGVSRPGVDARFNWPGFFGAAAAVTGAGGLASPLPLLRWAPVVMVLLYLPPLYVIGRQLTGSVTATWLGLWLFLPVNWVGQDYFAPQSLGFALYLSAIAITVVFFRQGDQLSLGRPLSALRDRFTFDGLPDVATTPRTRVGLVALLVFLAAAVAVSHQLSPIAFVVTSLALVVAGRSRLLVLPLIAGVVALGWISVGTTAYWVGHMNVLFGGVGDVGSVVGGVGKRVGGSPVHLALVKLRVAFTVAVWTLMSVSAVVLWIRRHPPLTLVTLAVAPFVLTVESYGSEGPLRIFLFSSPFACLIIAQALAAYRGRRAVQVAVLVGALALLPLFLVMRYGNESFEQVSPKEVEAMRVLYRTAPLGSNFVSPTSQVPWRFQSAADYRYTRPVNDPEFLDGKTEGVRPLISKEAEQAPRTYLIVTRSQTTYASEALGQPPGWFESVKPLLNRPNGYRLIYRNADALIYSYEAPS